MLSTLALSHVCAYVGVCVCVNIPQPNVAAKRELDMTHRAYSSTNPEAEYKDLWLAICLLSSDEIPRNPVANLTQQTQIQAIRSSACGQLQTKNAP